MLTLSETFETIGGVAAEPLEGAVCKGMDLDLFFPERGAPTEEAKAICRGCPARFECLRGALERRERFGIWGGVSERERRVLRRRVARGASIDSVVAEAIGRRPAVPSAARERQIA
ncbi:MAG TPA: WhiB family transcriptional regulator [Acidimicrobiia bacterium]|nr:WhiB family transcriptional regulator [Acidimicrobiia bacterium]